ncbi:MAG: transglutaminase N-terminal domain-containing protein, partial [Sandaracinobacteroides sp.]
MQLIIDHITSYRYSEPAAGIVQVLKLTPGETDCQQIVSWRIDVDADGRMMPTTDAHGNSVHIFYADRPIEALTLHVTGAVITTDAAGVVTGGAEPLPPILYRRTTPLTAITPSIAAFAEPFRTADHLAGLHGLMQGVRDRMQFEPGIT